MEITDIVVHTVSFKEVKGARADGTQDACILEIETDSDITGIGEAVSLPAVVDSVINASESHDKSTGLREILIGQNPFDIEVLWNEMFDRTYFYGRKGAAITAMSGTDIALWDIIGKATETPLHQLLGGKHCEAVRAHASTLFPKDPTETEQMRQKGAAARDDEFTAVCFVEEQFDQSISLG